MVHAWVLGAVGGGSVPHAMVSWKMSEKPFISINHFHPCADSRAIRERHWRVLLGDLEGSSVDDASIEASASQNGGPVRVHRAHNGRLT
jgi:hypothetical protein